MKSEHFLQSRFYNSSKMFRECIIYSIFTKFLERILWIIDSSKLPLSTRRASKVLICSSFDWIYCAACIMRCEKESNFRIPVLRTRRLNHSATASFQLFLIIPIHFLSNNLFRLFSRNDITSSGYIFTDIINPKSKMSLL